MQFFFFILSILLTMAWPFTFSVDVHTPSSLKNYANKISYPRTNPTFLQHFWDFTYIWIYILNALKWNFFWSIFRLRIQLVCMQTCMYLRISIFNIFATLKLAKFNYVPEWKLKSAYLILLNRNYQHSLILVSQTIWVIEVLFQSILYKSVKLEQYGRI